jgi:plasmid stability protein
LWPARAAAEAEHRVILAALLSPPRRKLADLLAAMPDVGRDTDFARRPEGGDDADVFS